jgi:tetratricopeptide (TPR) repeat protein
MNLARSIHLQDEPGRAMLLAQEAFELYAQLQDEGGVLWATLGMGDIQLAMGDYERAEVLAEEALALARKLDERLAIAFALNNLGEALLCRNKFTRAGSLFAESVAIFQQIDSDFGIWLGIIGLARIAVANGKSVQAVRLIAAVDAMSIEQDDPVSKWPPEHRNQYNRALTAVQAELDPETFAAAWQAGRALSLEEAVAEALG